MRKVAVFVTLSVLVLLSGKVLAFEPNTSDKLELNVQKAILEIKHKDSGIQKINFVFF